MTKEETEKEIPDFIQLFGDKDKRYCNAAIICNGKNIKVICQPGSTKEEKVIDFEYEDKISSIVAHDNYIVVNNSDIIMTEGKYSDVKILSFKNIKNIQEVKSNFISEQDFIENENGCFCTDELTEEEKLKLYMEQGFEKEYEKLRSFIEKRDKEEKERQIEVKEEKQELKDYIDSTKALLVPVVYSNPSDDITMDYGRVYDAENSSITHGRYYEDDENVQALYGIQEKGWRGRAYRGMIINVEMAKKLAKSGKLHLDVPEEAMGKIIGSKGSNINAVTVKLKEKGVNVFKIILHPKSKEEMTIALEKIAKTIREQKGQTHEEL